MLWLAAGGKTTDRSLHRIAVNVRARACESSHCRGLIDQSCCYADRGVAGCWPTLPVVSSWQQHGSAASECYSLTCARTHPARVCVCFFYHQCDKCSASVPEEPTWPTCAEYWGTILHALTPFDKSRSLELRAELGYVFTRMHSRTPTWVDSTASGCCTDTPTHIRQSLCW